jgi:hypothetical protein
MNKFTLLLLSGSTMLGLLLPLGSIEATAKQLKQSKNTATPVAATDRFCVTSHSRLVCAKSSQILAVKAGNEIDGQKFTKAQLLAQLKDPESIMNFSDDESDAAAAMFGCDCPGCLRSLRYLRAMATVS